MVENVYGEEIVLVDEKDRPVGLEEKIKAHQNGGKLHRAFSVFIFDADRRLLLQRRANGKYHFAGLWSNTCCGHPRKDERTEDAARRRLEEEMGFSVKLEKLFDFVYHAHDLDSGLTEHEFDHIFCGRFDGEPAPNPVEVEEWEWTSLEKLLEDLESNPQRFTPWFGMVVPRVIEYRLRRDPAPYS